MPDRMWWPILEIDANDPQPFDVVMKEHADDLSIGDRCLLVATERAPLSNNDGHQIFRLTWGWATWGRVVDIKPTNSDPNLIVVKAEYDDAQFVSDG